MTAVTCALCGERIVSKSRHDFVVCSCGHSFADGGGSYMRYGTLTAGPKPLTDDEVLSGKAEGGEE